MPTGDGSPSRGRFCASVWNSRNRRCSCYGGVTRKTPRKRPESRSRHGIATCLNIRTRRNRVFRRAARTCPDKFPASNARYALVILPRSARRKEVRRFPRFSEAVPFPKPMTSYAPSALLKFHGPSRDSFRPDACAISARFPNVTYPLPSRKRPERVGPAGEMLVGKGT